MQSSGGFTDFQFLLCAQSQSKKWDVKGERAWDWDVDEILTQTGYLKPLTFFSWSACWKWPQPDVASSEEAVFTLSQIIRGNNHKIWCTRVQCFYIRSQFKFLIHCFNLSLMCCVFSQLSWNPVNLFFLFANIEMQSWPRLSSKTT